MIQIDIEKFLSLDNYEVSRQDRRKGKNATQEFFTPYEIVKKMCNKISEEDWSDKTKTFMEPCCGNFQFGCYIIYNRIMHGIDWKTALETLYALDLMEDNIQESKQRVHKLFEEMNIDYDKDTANSIMDKRIICHDFFTWNFSEWREYTEEELKKIKKK